MNNMIQQQRTSGKMVAGIILVILGSMLLLDQNGVDIPNWIISWPMFLIAIGIHSGVKNNFSKPGAFIMIFFGLVFLVDNYFLDLHFSIVWPAMLIGAGIWLVLKNKPLAPSQAQVTSEL